MSKKIILLVEGDEEFHKHQKKSIIDFFENNGSDALVLIADNLKIATDLFSNNIENINLVILPYQVIKNRRTKEKVDTLDFLRKIIDETTIKVIANSASVDCNIKLTEVSENAITNYKGENIDLTKALELFFPK